MVIIFFIILFEISFSIHLYFLFNFISKKQDKDFRGFIITTITNIFMGILTTIFIIIFPSQIKEINFDRFLFLESGFLFLIMIFVKVRITMKIYQRSKDPAYYHYSYFGRKVLNKNAVSATDVLTYFLTLPLTLICGAYFVAKLSCY